MNTEQQQIYTCRILVIPSDSSDLVSPHTIAT